MSSRWFILSDKCLYYFEYTTDKEPRGIIPLENVSVRDATDRSNRQHCFELFAVGGTCIKACKTDSDGKVVEGESRGINCVNSFLNRAICRIFSVPHLMSYFAGSWKLRALIF